MATPPYSTTARPITATTRGPRRQVIYDAVTRDYCCQFDDQVIGYASTYAAGEAMLNAFVHDLLVAGLLDPTPDTPPTPDAPPAPPAPPAPCTSTAAPAPDDWQLTRLSATIVRLTHPALACDLILTTTQLATLRALLDVCVIVPPTRA